VDKLPVGCGRRNSTRTAFPQLESAFEAILSAVGFILGDVVDHDHFPAPLDFVANGGFGLAVRQRVEGPTLFHPVHRKHPPLLGNARDRGKAHSRRAANDLKNRWHRLDTVTAANHIGSRLPSSGVLAPVPDEHMRGRILGPGVVQRLHIALHEGKVLPGLLAGPITVARPTNHALASFICEYLLLLSSDRNTLDLIERDFVAGAIVELGGAWAFVRRHGLRIFERAARLEVGGDAGRPEHMATELPL
jgi:hypothetical protein